MEETFIHLLSFLVYLVIFALAISYILRAGWRDLREVRQKLRKRGLSLKDVFFRIKPYNFWPERPVSLREAFMKGAVFSTFIFSLTGVLGTSMSMLNYTRLTTNEILCIAFTSAFTASLLAIIINYTHQRIVKKFGEPLETSEES